MLRHLRALWVNAVAVLVGCASLVVAVGPARGQIPSPPLSNSFPFGSVVPASFESSAANSYWHATEAATTAESLAPPCAAGCSDDGCCGLDPSWYVMLSGAVQSRSRVHEVNDPATFLTFDDGFAINAALGHQFDLFRFDFEYSYFNNQIETAGAGIPGVGNFVGDAVGNVSIKAYTLNGYYDYLIEGTPWKPYVGGGIGLMQSEINSLFPSFFPQLNAATGGVNTTSNVKFCYQFRVGLSYELTYRTDLYSGYRFFDAGELTFAGEPFGVFHPNCATFHHFEGGLRVRF